jgi:transposase
MPCLVFELEGGQPLYMDLRRTVNARHLKQVPGRKSDIRDCQWIAQLLQHGLLKGSFIPSRPQRELRDLTRHRVPLVEEKTRTSGRREDPHQQPN